MKLIADSGSTKTDWRLIDDNNQIHQYSTQGINPYFQTPEEINEILISELLSTIISEHDLGDDVEVAFDVWFYGAGCELEEKKAIIREAISEAFPASVIEVESDMLGAARALCGTNPGIVAILGTGSNTCYYDGKKIAESVDSLGYILGDEGSGAHIGKTFIQAYLNKELPQQLSKRFYERTNLGLPEILNAVYKKPLPNRFLASFSKFIYQNVKEQFIVDIVANCFEQFFDKHVCKYEQHKNIPLSCVGSVAFYYSNILRAVANKKGVNIEIITETPIAGLTLYHQIED